MLVPPDVLPPPPPDAPGLPDVEKPADLAPPPPP
jgi:hypothetical protein